MVHWGEAWGGNILRTFIIHSTHTAYPHFNFDHSHRPETIPHLSQQQSSGSVPRADSISGAAGAPALHPTLSHGSSGSPVKESTLQRGMSVDEQDGGDDIPDDVKATAAAAEEKGIPIRKS